MAAVRYKLDRLTELTDDDVKPFQAKWIYDDGQPVTLDVKGKCPTCQHDTHRWIALSVVLPDGDSLVDDVVDRFGSLLPRDLALKLSLTLDLAAFKRRRTGDEAKIRMLSRPIVMSCRCREGHPAGGGKFGCGRSWLLVVTTGSDGAARLSPPGPDDLALWETLLELDRVYAEAGTSVPEQAAKWQAALAAILALWVPFTFVSWKALQEIDSRWMVPIVVSVAVYFVAAVVGLGLAHLAAIGSPVVLPLNDRSSIEKLAIDNAARARRGIRRIHLAMAMLAVAVLASLATLISVLIAPAKPTQAPSPKVAISFTTGEQWPCVVLLGSDNVDMVKLRLADGGVVEKPAANVSQLAVTSC